MIYNDDLDLSASLKERVQKVFRLWKKRKPKNLDTLFHEAHDRSFEEIDCLQCANCCKTTSPIFRDKDIQRIAKKFKMTESSFEDQYLQLDEEGDWVLKSSPCTFLNTDNTCFIYDIRPQACKEYPHTDRKRMVQILDLTQKNMEVCPAVRRTVERVIDKNG